MHRQPARAGHFDGENYNLGLLTPTDVPYRKMGDAAGATHAGMYDVHARKSPPFSQSARVRS